MINVLIADDQDDVRGAFRLIVDAQPDMTVVGEAADGITAAELAGRLHPDVVLADIRMPGLDGLELTRLLAGPQAANPTRVVIVTTFDLDDYVHTALRHGACGFLLKRSGPNLLTEAIRAAMAGDALISPQITVRLLRHLTTTAATADRRPREPLTDRENNVVELIAQGKTNAEISAELFITLGTAKNHVANIQRKLDARNRVAIAVWAWETGHAVPRTR